MTLNFTEVSSMKRYVTTPVRSHRQQLLMFQKLQKEAINLFTIFELLTL